MWWNCSAVWRYRRRRSDFPFSSRLLTLEAETCTISQWEPGLVGCVSVGVEVLTLTASSFILQILYVWHNPAPWDQETVTDRCNKWGCAVSGQRATAACSAEREEICAPVERGVAKTWLSVCCQRRKRSELRSNPKKLHIYLGWCISANLPTALSTLRLLQFSDSWYPAHTHTPKPLSPTLRARSSLGACSRHKMC